MADDTSSNDNALFRVLPSDHPGRTTTSEGFVIWPLGVRNVASGGYLTIGLLADFRTTLFCSGPKVDVWNFAFNSAQPETIRLQHKTTGKWVVMWNLFAATSLRATADSIDDAAIFNTDARPGGWGLWIPSAPPPPLYYYGAAPLEHEKQWFVAGLPFFSPDDPAWTWTSSFLPE